MSEVYGVIGLGYVGLPVAVGFARAHGRVVGFDIKERRIEALGRGVDETREFAAEELRGLDLRYTSDAQDLAGCTFFIVTVPTPIDGNRQPDLSPLRRACETIGPALRRGSVVVFESTVYPGVTEEVCGPLLAKSSGLACGSDFTLGYSPERINPGDREHRLETITKVIAGSDASTLERMAAAYGAVVKAGMHRAPTIKVAEAAKVIENTQRDLNIALMNELSVIFDRMGIRTRDVLAAAATKWNFLRFTPGLVGGHCIGVDPYYLTAKAESLGYHPEVILAGRRINDGMGAFVAQKLVKSMIRSGSAVSGGRVGILGLTFKENVPDLRNSRVPDIIRELTDFGLTTLVHDPLADAHEAQEEYGVTLSPFEELRGLDAVILAVPHSYYSSRLPTALVSMLADTGVLADLKGALDPAQLPAGIATWSL